jgi:hypothetical protein
MIILVIFEFYEKYLAIFYLLYGPALVSFTYVVSHFFDTEGVGQTIILLINLIFGALGGAAILILRVNKDMKKLGIALSYIFRLVPSFCISYGYSQLMSQKALFAVDYYKNSDDYEILKRKFDDPNTIIKDALEYAKENKDSFLQSGTPAQQTPQPQFSASTGGNGSEGGKQKMTLSEMMAMKNENPDAVISFE